METAELQDLQKPDCRTQQTKCLCRKPQPAAMVVARHNSTKFFSDVRRSWKSSLDKIIDNLSSMIVISALYRLVAAPNSTFEKQTQTTFTNYLLLFGRLLTDWVATSTRYFIVGYTAIRVSLYHPRLNIHSSIYPNITTFNSISESGLWMTAGVGTRL